MLSNSNTNDEKDVLSDHIKRKSLVSPKNMVFAILIGVFATLVIMAFPDALSGNVNEVECANDAPDCIAVESKPNNYLVWIGVYLCSLFGLILMTFKSIRENKGPTLIVGIASAAALNTLMWMLLVYIGAFIVNLF